MRHGLLTFVLVAAASGLLPSARAQTSGAPDGESRLGDQIAVLEDVLALTVAQSARSVEARLPAAVSGTVLFAGPTQVRGFRLPGFGVFFDVEYPVLRRAVLWSMQVLTSDLEADFEMLRLRLQRLAQASAFDPALVEDAPRVARSRTGYATRAYRRVWDVVPAPPPPAPRRRATRDDAPPPDDPDVRYRDVLARHLEEVVLRHGGDIAVWVGPDEWVALTARDGRGQRDRDITFRVRARDILAVRNGSLTLDAAHGRVARSPN